MANPHSTFLGLECARCGSQFESGDYFEGCPACRTDGWAANLSAQYDLDAAKLQWGRPSGFGIWRYAPLLPLRNSEHQMTLGEGQTPLVAFPGLQGIRKVWVKNESANPTWSYKDRMCAVGISMALDRGARTIAVSSTGNQGASATAYAARAGLEAVVLTREDIEDPTLAFLQVYGATVVKTSRYGRWDLLRHGVEQLGWYPISSFSRTPTGNPFAVEGYKTIAYEIFEQLGEAPDAIAVPTCYGEGLAGVHAGFVELRAMGFIDTVPRMIAAEPAAGAPLWRTVQAKADRVVSVEPYPTVATSLGCTIATDRALLAISESAGRAIPVSDEELLKGQAALLKGGLFAEPSGVAGVAALPHLADDLPDFDKETSSVVVLMTGGGLRQLPLLRRTLPAVDTIEATPAALESALLQ